LLDTHAIKQHHDAPDAWVDRTMHRTPAEQEAVLSTSKLKLLKVLQWARAHGCRWDKQDLECASGHSQSRKNAELQTQKYKRNDGK
jgi:hypothetical protein